MADLSTRFDRLHLGQGHDGTQPHRSTNLGVPSSTVRKQRSQRFTVPTAHPTHSDSPSSAGPVPSLPYQPPPLPVQAQSANLFHLADSLPPAPLGPQDPRAFYSSSLPDPYAQYASYPAPPVPPTLAPEFLASPTGMSPYPGPAFRPPPSFAGAYGAVAHGYAAPPQAPLMQHKLSDGSATGGFTAQGPGSDPDDEIIETAIVIKNIPFVCPKEQLLAIMSSLALPPPFAFNYHFAPEDPTSFRGLAFANYRSGEEAGVVRAAMDGLEVMGRKLRCEFKKALKPGEKEAIERTKALKRMRSAQRLAVGANGAAPDFSTWNRREASAPGTFAPGPTVGAPLGGGWNAGLGVGFGNGASGVDAAQDYGQAWTPGLATFGPDGGAARNGGMLPTSFGQREYVAAAGVAQPQYSGPAGVQLEPSYSSESASTSPLSSDVGTSVSQRMERGADSADSEVGTVATTASVGPTASKNELDLNDPPTLELFSRVLLFQGDSLRDEFAFSRSLASQQRRTVHLIAKKLGLEHRSIGEGDARHVVVYKPGTGPRRPLRGSLSTAALRRVVSRDGISSSATVRNGSSSYLPPPLPASYLLPSHTGGSVTSSLATSVAGLKGKKSMPNLTTTSGHFLPRGHGLLRGASSSSEEDRRSPSPVPAVPPMPTSISLSAHLAAYASGNGYASSASPLSASPGSGGVVGANGSIGGGVNAASAAFTRRSYSNLRSMASSPARDSTAGWAGTSPYATVGHYAGGSPTKRREVPSVQGLFPAPESADSAPASPARDPGAGSEDDWRRRA